MHDASTLRVARGSFATWSLILKIALLPVQVLVAEAGTLGMVADDGSDSVVVFDADSLAVVGSVPVGPGVVGDCSITSDQSRGFVTDFQRRVWTIDLTASPPALAAASPIAIANPGEDTALTPDERFLLVCDGFANEPISVIDVASGAQVSTFPLGSNCSSVDVCPDGSVLAGSSSAGRVHRLLLDASGTLTHTGEILFTGWLASRGPNNVACAPDSASGVVVRRTPPELRSFLIPGLTAVTTRPLTGPGSGISADFSSDNRVFVRSDGGAVDVFEYDPVTAVLGASPVLTIPTSTAISFLGIDQIALGPGESTLWVTEPGVLNVYHPESGVLLDSVHDPALISPSGVCFPAVEPERCGDGGLDDGEACDDGNAVDGDGCSAACEIENRPPHCASAVANAGAVWPPRGQMTPVHVEGASDPDGDPLAVMVTSVRQDEPVAGGTHGRTCPDASLASDGSATVRIERRGAGGGRVYHLGFTADDGRGGLCQGTVSVCVPRSPDHPLCSDQGETDDSTVCPLATSSRAIKRRGPR